MPQTPFISIEQCINTYRYLFKPRPKFGMDFFAEDFEAKEIVLLEDAKAGACGIPIRFNYYALFLRMKGETKRTINQFEYTIRPQSLQLLNPGTIYSFEELSEESKTYVLLFSKKFIGEGCLSPEIQDALLDFHRINQRDVCLGSTQFAQAVFLYEQLNSELRARNNDYKTVSKILIYQLLFLLKREKLNAGAKQKYTRAEQICSEFLILIETHFWTKKTVKAYAEILGITPKHLTETVKETLPYSALSCIHIRMIKEIQYLLSFSEMPIKQIAYALHFDTLSQFGRFFKRHEGISPKAYRLKNRDLIQKMNV